MIALALTMQEKKNWMFPGMKTFLYTHLPSLKDKIIYQLHVLSSEFLAFFVLLLPSSLQTPGKSSFSLS